VNLELKNLLGVFWVVDLLSNLRSFLVHASLEEALSMIQFVLNDVGVELGQLIVHVGGTAIVLDVEIAVSKQGKSGAVSRRELKLIRKNANNFHILLIAD